MTHTQYLLGDELFVLGSILFSVAAFISALLAVSEEASTPSKLKVSPYIGVCRSSPPLYRPCLGGLSRLLIARSTHSGRAIEPPDRSGVRPSQAR